MKLTLPAALCLAAIALAPLASEAPAYSIKATVDPVKGSIDGDFAIRCPVAPGQGSIYLRMDLNLREEPNPKLAMLVQENGPRGFEPSRARALDIRIDGAEAASSFVRLDAFASQEYSLEHLLLRIDLPEASRGKGEVGLAFRYRATISGMSALDDVRAGDFLASRFSWLPRVADPAAPDAHELAPFSYTAEIASAVPGWELVPSGSAFRKTAEGSWTTAGEKPLASLPLVMTKGFNSYSLPFENGAKTLTLFYRKGCDFTARALATHAIDALTAYKSDYYPLDYPTVAIVQGLPGTYGMTADGLVVLGSTFFDGLDSIVPRAWDRLPIYVLWHELGHFYFGIGASPDFDRDNYLSEGMNELSTMRFIEAKFSRWDNIRNRDLSDIGDFFLGSLLTAGLGGDSWRAAKYAKILDQDRRGFAYPISHDPAQAVLNAASVTDYDRGQIVPEMLESYVGTKAFDAGIAAYLQTVRHGTTSTALLRAAMEKASGLDLGDFFSAYVTGTEALDYSLSGRLNGKAFGAYRHELSVGFTGKGPFVPVILRLFLEGGATKDTVVSDPGAVIVETERRASYAMLDPDFRSLDVARLDNALPRQVQFNTRSNYGMLDSGAAVKVGSSLSFATNGGYGYVGESLYVGFPGYWQVKTVPLAGVYLTDILGRGLRFAAIGTVDLPSPRGVSASLKAFHDLGGISNATGATAFSAAPALPSSVNLSLSWSPDLRADLGRTGTCFTRPLSFSGNFSLSRLGAAEPAYAQTVTASLDLVQIAGFSAALSDDFSLPLQRMTPANRVGVDLAGRFAPLPRTMASIGVSGAWTSGAVGLLGSGDEVNGFSSSLDSPRAFRLEANAFFGCAVVNGLNANWIKGATLQSLHLGLAYQAATAFDAPDRAAAGIRQSLGLILIPTFRTILDIRFTAGLGAAVDLSRILRAPADPGSYAPGLFIDLSDSTLFGSLFAY